MAPLHTGGIGCLELLGLILLRASVFRSFTGTGKPGLFQRYGVEAALTFIPRQIFSQTLHITFATIPLFLYCTRCRLSKGRL